MRKIRSNIVQPLPTRDVTVLPDHIIEIGNGAVTALRPYAPAVDSDAEDMLTKVVMPGMIDLHVHLSQWDMRGSYEPALLPWLQKHVFPAEARSQNQVYARSVASRFFNALHANGTTLAVVYTAPFRQACDIAFEVARDAGSRVFMGMTLMDGNSPADLIQDSRQAYNDSVELFGKWDGASGRLRYIFTPRFAPTCSIGLMRAIGRFASDHSAWVQSHLSENRDEIRWVKELFHAGSYTDVYLQAGLLGPRTLMAHAIHLDDTEIATLKSTGTRIVHCPDSNFFLKSGEFPFDRMQSAGIIPGIGSDVGAGTTLSMLHHAHMACYRQSVAPLLPGYLLWNITLGNAGLLDLDASLGSFDPGKEADLCVIDIPRNWPLDDSLPSRLIFCSHETKVDETVIAGDTVYKAAPSTF